MHSSSGEGVFEQAIHTQELAFLHILSPLLFTRLYNHYYYAYFYPQSLEKLSKLPKITKLEHVSTHQPASACTCATAKLLSARCFSFLPGERLTRGLRISVWLHRALKILLMADPQQ